MTLHLLKLCVGISSVEELAQLMIKRGADATSRGVMYQPFHLTRMMPKRASELLEGGSLYWVIAGSIAARQALLDIVPVRGDDSILRCKFVLDDELISVVPRTCSPFQGWRYLTGADATPDRTGTFAEFVHVPEAMLLELRQLGLV